MLQDVPIEGPPGAHLHASVTQGHRASAVNVWVLLVLVIVVSAAVAVGTILVANRAISAFCSSSANSTLGPFVTTVALVYGTLLGFTVVVAWEQFSSAELNVANEASTLATMYRQTVAMPVQEQQEIRVLLRRYTTAVQGPEWRQQEQHEVSGASDTARSAITEMYRVLGLRIPIPPRRRSTVSSSAN